MKRRVVITSLGVISPLGKTIAEIQASLREERVSFQRFAGDLPAVVAPVNDFDLKSYTGSLKERRYLHRGSALALAAALDAMRASGLGKEEREQTGLFVGAGPYLDIGAEFPFIENGNIRQGGMDALWILRFLPNTTASIISQSCGIHGENLTVGTACAASLTAVGEAFRRIRDGYLDRALAGGGDSRLNPGSMLAYEKAGVLAHGDAPFREAGRPFDRQRGGFVSGEGAGFFLLEEREQALARGAKIWAEIAGYGSSLDGYRMTAPAPDGRMAVKAIQQAMADAREELTALDFIAAHGTGTALNDQIEAQVLETLFPEQTPAVIALKSWIGHLSTACGAVELAVILAAQATGLLPEIRNLRHPVSSRIDFVRAKRFFRGKLFLLENFGFGGQNAALVIRQ
jgi:3-oxoacyl-[acyl-carrier-protein] synthase II